MTFIWFLFFLFTFSCKRSLKHRSEQWHCLGRRHRLRGFLQLSKWAHSLKNKDDTNNVRLTYREITIRQCWEKQCLSNNKIIYYKGKCHLHKCGRFTNSSPVLVFLSFKLRQLGLLTDHMISVHVTAVACKNKGCGVMGIISYLI